MAIRQDSKHQERRRHVRSDVQRSAKLIYGPHAYSVACVVRDVSEGGARVELRAEAMLPQTLTLIDAGHRTPAQVVWRRGREVGLAFVHPVKDKPSVARRLWSAVSGR